MPGANAQSLRQRLHATILQTTLPNKTQSSGHSHRSAQPGGCSGRAFWPATQARAKTRVGGRSCGGKVADIAFLTGPRATNRATVDSSGEHGNEKLAVEARIARESRARTYPPIQIHIASR